MITLFKNSFAVIKLIFFLLEDLIIWLWSLLKYIIVIAVIVSSITIYKYLNHSYDASDTAILRIYKGTVFYKLTEQLHDQRFIESKLLFRYFSRYFEYDTHVRSGEFEIPKGMTEFQLAEFLLNAKPLLRKVTIIEGLKYNDIAGILSANLELDSTKIMKLFNQNSLLKRFEISAENLEGYLLPQTYHFELGISESDAIEYLLEQNKLILEKFSKRSKNAFLTPHQILTLASIVQAECTLEEEMPLVASLYSNRLRRNMLLQADPTVHFAFYLAGLPKPSRVLYRHLEIKSPYNTYINKGLPPGPINNPGKAAIMAAINPANTDYLYMVTDGTNSGRHLFGKTLREHNQNREGLERARKRIYGN